MAQDLVVSFLSSVPPSVLGKFTSKPAVLAVPAAPLGQGMVTYRKFLAEVADGQGRIIPGLFRRAGGTGTIGRVAFVGFSNGVDAGLSQVLGAYDAKKIDFVGAFDGIHGSFVPGTKRLWPPTYAKWIAFARLAAGKRRLESGPCLVITHSSIEPAFPSTTETAELVWEQALLAAPKDYESWIWGELTDLVYPGGKSIQSVRFANDKRPTMPEWTWSGFADGWYIQRAGNGLSVFGWGDPGTSPEKRFNARTRDRTNGTADHIFQAQAVLPAVLQSYLVERWNAQEQGATGGLGSSAATGRRYDELPDGPLDNPFPLGGVLKLPEAVPPCPYPPPGQVIVGKPGDPCSTQEVNVARVVGGPTTSGAGRVLPLVLAAGVAGAGFLTARQLVMFAR